MESAEAATPTDSTTTLSITSSNSANVELLVKDSNGTFASSTSSQKLTFGVTTNNYAGYELTLLGKDSTYANLKNSSTNTNLTSISTASTITSSSFSNGNWGYTLDGTNYRSAPNNTTGYTIERTTVANASTAKTYTLGIGAKANYSTKAGTYTNTYVLTAVGNGTPYSITYADNSGDSSVANLPSIQQSTEGVSAPSITLTSVKPTRTGYTFSKWCEGTVSNNGTTCTGTTYNSGASFGIDRTVGNNSTTLYAVWTVKSYTLNITNNNTTSNPASSTTINFKGSTNITVTPADGYYLSEVTCPTGYTCTGYTTGSDAASAQTVTVTNGNGTTGTDAGGTIEFTAASAVDGYLQDFTASECSAMSTNETKTLGDTRDGQAYTIAKLADGNCWMDNLNLNATNVDLTSSNTNLSATVDKDTFNGWKKSSGSASYTAAEFIPVSGTDSTSGTAYGTLYNYCAASAGTVCISSTTDSTDFSHDICPKGWRLPTGGSSGEFQTLYSNSSYNTYAKMRAPIANGGAAFALAGYFNNSTPTGQGSGGYYWSSTRRNDSIMYRLRLVTSTVYPANYTSRYDGSSIRCVKKTAAEEAAEELGISYLQDLTTATASSLPNGTTLALKDNRDGQSYIVKKLEDGNFWMMTNLNLNTSNVDLTSSNTNVSTTVAKATFNGWKKTSGSGTYTAAEMIAVSGTDSTSKTAYGTLYNYCAASAGTVCISSTTTSTDFSHDICPKGWRLPTGGTTSSSTNEFNNLYKLSNYNTNAKMRAPIANGGAAFALAGYFNNSTPTGQGSVGYYWSSTRSGGTGMYLLNLDTSGVNPAGSSNRSSGVSIRCVLKTAADEVNGSYMQDVTAAQVSALSDGATINLVDSRDNQQYTAAKINGQLWMTRNLAIGCNGSGTSYGSSISSKSLTSANSNISASSWSTPTANLSAGNSYDEARMACSSTYGAWYNYAAASAGTITGSSNENTQTYDICPKGWRLPTNSEFSRITSYSSAYSPVTGGYYEDGSLDFTGYGYWWSATSSYSTSRYRLRYNGGSLDTSYVGRYYGFYVRCIRSAS